MSLNDNNEFLVVYTKLWTQLTLVSAGEDPLLFAAV
jgi:hypothetical protein